MSERANLFTFGQRVKKIRKEKKITQAKLAEKIDMSTNFIGMIERGNRNTTIDNMFNIIYALEMTPENFFKGM